MFTLIKQKNRHLHKYGVFKQKSEEALSWSSQSLTDRQVR